MVEQRAVRRPRSSRAVDEVRIAFTWYWLIFERCRSAPDLRRDARRHGSRFGACFPWYAVP